MPGGKKDPPDIVASRECPTVSTRVKVVFSIERAIVEPWNPKELEFLGEIAERSFHDSIHIYMYIIRCNDIWTGRIRNYRDINIPRVSRREMQRFEQEFERRVRWKAAPSLVDKGRPDYDWIGVETSLLRNSTGSVAEKTGLDWE